MLRSLDRRRLSEALRTTYGRTDGRATVTVTATAAAAAREERAGAEVAAAARECGSAMVDGARVRGRRKAGAFPHFGAGAAVVGQREARERAGERAARDLSSRPIQKKEKERKREERENEAAAAAIHDGRRGGRGGGKRLRGLVLAARSG